jgi:hypothetical protein
MRKIVRRRDIETRLVPEKGKAQQRCMQQKNDDKDQRK